MSERKSVAAAAVRMGSTLIGLAVAAIAGSVAASIVAVVAWGYADASQPIETLATVGVASIASMLMLVLPLALSLGWLVHIFMLRIGFTGPFVYSCFGASLAMIACRIFLMRLTNGSYIPQGQLVESLLLAGFAGGIGALVFWALRRPDRDAISAPPQP